MKAIILAGGRGDRLGALTQSRPKPMVEVAGRPILDYLIAFAAKAGIGEFLVNIGYMGHVIRDYLGSGSRFGVDVTCFEAEGKAPEAAVFAGRSRIDDDSFCCLCGDNILLPDQVAKIVQTYEGNEADAVFTLEPGNSAATKRVRVADGRILGSGRDARDPVLVYNMAMATSFLDELLCTVANREETAFAFAMDDLAEGHVVLVADIGGFININMPEDVADAEIILRDLEIV